MNDQPTQDNNRIYGVPESIEPRSQESERLELFVDVDRSAEQASKIFKAVGRIFSDPKAAKAFQADPEQFLTEMGLSELAIQWNRFELQVGLALGDPILKKCAHSGDAKGFLKRLKELKLLPQSMDVTLEKADAMGFGLAVWLGAIVAVLVQTLAVVQSYVGVWLIALLAVFAVAAVGTTTWANGGGGPGGDNPDDNEDAGSGSQIPPIIRQMNSLHVQRLLQRTLNLDLLQKLATFLHDQGFGQEVTAELVKEVILSAWHKQVTGEDLTPPELEQLYVEIGNALNQQAIVDLAPELTSIARYAMLASGFVREAFQLLVKMKEPFRFVSIDFNPEELLVYQKVLIIPSGALFGLDNSTILMDRLEEYTRLGGTVICMAQQHGYDYRALPGGIEGYGWVEDQSCHARSVVITAPHPIFAGQDTEVMDVSIDGFFSSWPEDADILLRRRINGQPAMLGYSYGEGRVVVTSAYADWGIGHSQLTPDERHLMRDLITWARMKDRDVPEYDPDDLPFRIQLFITNESPQSVSKISFTAIDPNKEVVEDKFSIDTNIEPGETVEIGLETSDMTALGYWSLDAVLRNSEEELVYIQYDAAVFLVNNFDDTLDGVGYKNEPLTFSVVTPSEHYLEKETARLSLLIWNHSSQNRTVSIRTDLNHGSPLTQKREVPAGRRTEVVYEFEATKSGRFRFWASLFDERDRSLGTTTKGYFVHKPQARVRVQIDKETYRPGEQIMMDVSTSNRVGASYDADMSVIISDPSGNILFDEYYRDTLRPGIPIEESFQFALPITVRYGAFKVHAEASLDGKRIGYHEVFFTPVLEGHLEGRILNAVTDEVVPEAKVWMDNNPSVFPDPETGAFSFVASLGGHWVTAEAPGFARERAYTSVSPERTSKVEHIYLTPLKGFIEGRVSDVITNKPIPGAKIEPSRSSPLPVAEDGSFVGALPRGEQWLHYSAENYSGRPRMLMQVYSHRSSKVAPLYLTPTRGRISGTVFSAEGGEVLQTAQVHTSGMVPLSVDESGSFSLDLPVGNHNVFLNAPGHDQITVSVAVPAGRSISLDALYLVPSFGEVTGTVYDTSTGEPLPNAQVIISRQPVSASDADGRYHFRLPIGNHTLQARTSGYKANSITISIVAGKSLEGIDLGLIPSKGVISGLILDAANAEPLPNAMVRLDTGALTITQEDGAFSFPAITGLRTITVEASGYESLNISAEIYPGRETKLKTTYLTSLNGSVSGRLVDAFTGAVIANGRVWSDNQNEVFSNESGEFKLDLPSGRRNIYSEAASFQPSNRIDILVLPGKNAHIGDIALTQSIGLINGQVTDENGLGVAGVEVWPDQNVWHRQPDIISVRSKVQDRYSNQPLAGVKVSSSAGQIAFSDDDGDFELRLRPGFHRITAHLTNYVDVSFSARADWGFSSILDAVYLTPAIGSVIGQVASAVTGRPIPFARVWSNPQEWVVADEEGKFEISLRPGTVYLYALAEGYRQHPGILIDVVAGKQTEISGLFLAPLTGHVKGTVQDLITGEPITGALVWPDRGEGTYTDSDGHYQLTLEPGNRSLTATAKGYQGEIRASVNVIAGLTTTLNALPLTHFKAHLTGIVRSAVDGTPIPRTRIWVDNKLDDVVLTDEEGRFAIQVSPGTHRLWAERHGFKGQASANFFAMGGNEVSADLLFLIPADASVSEAGPGTFSGELKDATTGDPLSDTLVWWGGEDFSEGVLRQNANTYVTEADDTEQMGTHIVTGDASWADYTLSFEAKALDNDGWGCLIRYVDENNYYRFMCGNDVAVGGPFRRIEKMVDGVRTILASDTVPYIGKEWMHLSLQAHSDSLSVIMDEVEIFNVQDDGLAAGRIGFACAAQQGQYFRAIQVNTADALLLREQFTSGLDAWEIIDAPDAKPPSSWEVEYPTGARTDEEGRFEINNIPQGNHTLYLDPQAGYQTYWTNKTVCTFSMYPGRHSALAVQPVPAKSALSGVLRDSENGQPVEGTRVFIKGTRTEALTDSEGRFHFMVDAVGSDLRLRSMNVRATDPRYILGERPLFNGSIALGKGAEFETELTKLPGSIAVQTYLADTDAPIPDVEIYYGNRDLRWGGFALKRTEGHRAGDLYIEAPALITGESDWEHTTISFEAKCDNSSGWGAVLRYANRFSCYRLFYVANGQENGALLRLTKREEGFVTILAEVNAEDARVHDPRQWYTVKFDVNGNTLTVDIDDERLFEVNDDTLTVGQAGVLAYGNRNTTLRNIEVVGPEGVLVSGANQGAWVEEPGFGYTGGRTTAVPGPIEGEEAVDITHVRHQDFEYYFPVSEGEFRVELTYVEAWHQEEGLRRFSVLCNGDYLEEDLDVFAEAGFKKGLRRTYTVTSEKGRIHLLFRSITRSALVAYIRVFKGGEIAEGEVPIYEVRSGSTTDRPLFQTNNLYGRLTGGNPKVGTEIPVSEDVSERIKTALQSYRDGNSTYRFDLTPGNHTCHLYFAEHRWQSPGQRSFSVELNGEIMLNDVDIVRRVGYQQLHTRSFSFEAAIEMVDLSFVSIKNTAVVSAIAIDQGTEEEIFIDCGSQREFAWIDASKSSFSHIPSTQAATNEQGIAIFNDIVAGGKTFQFSTENFISANRNKQLITVPIFAGRSHGFRTFLMMPHSQISGRVLDATSGEAIEGASVWHTSDQNVVLTDTSGRFVFDEVAIGARTIHVSADGYKALATRTDQVQVFTEIDGIYTVTLRMTPDSFSPEQPYNPDSGPVETDADGNWRFEAPSGRRSISMEGGLLTRRRNISADLFPGRSLVFNLQVSEEEKTTVSGQIVNAFQVASEMESSAPLLNPNDASFEELEALPGLGDTRALAIIEYREKHPRFTSLKDLDNVPGIGPSTLKNIAPYFTFEENMPLGPASSWQHLRIAHGDANLSRGLLRQKNNTFVINTGEDPPFSGTHVVLGANNWSSYRFSFQSRCSSPHGWGALFHYVDEGNFYRFLWLNNPANGGPLRRIERVKNGTYTILAERDGAFPLNRWIDIDILVDGAKVAVEIDGWKLLEAEDDQIDKGRVGLLCWNQPNQSYRDIRAVDSEGNILYEETFKDDLASWTIIDNSRVNTPSLWEIVAPQSAEMQANNTYQLNEIPAGFQIMSVLGEDVRTGTNDNRLMSLQAYPGDQWSTTTSLAPATSTLKVKLIDSISKTPVENAHIWAGSVNDRDEAPRTDQEGVAAIAIRQGSLFGPLISTPLFVEAANYDVASNRTHVSLPAAEVTESVAVLQLQPKGTPFSGLVRKCGRRIAAVRC